MILLSASLAWMRPVLQEYWTLQEPVVISGDGGSEVVCRLEDLSKSPFLLASRSMPPHDDGWSVEAWRRAPLDALEDGGTLVVNGAAETMPKLAKLAVAAIDELDLPSSINCYATRAGHVAAPPHSDSQDIVALQCAGTQRWRVWRGGDETRDVGKAERFVPREPPVLDVVLRVGDALYVPLGWPHATDTFDSTATSLHATLGLDTVVFGLPRQRPTAQGEEWQRVLDAQRKLYAVDETATSKKESSEDWARRYRTFALDLVDDKDESFREAVSAAVDVYVNKKLTSTE